MGLDMYLMKARRIGNVSAKDVIDINEYLDWNNNEEARTKYTLKEWCGTEISDNNIKLSKEYESDFIDRYWLFDVEKSYPRKRIYKEVACWRKANAIHKWFVDNIQDGNDDCGVYEVSEEQLRELLELCKIVAGHSELVDGKIKNGYKIDKNFNEIPIMEDGKYIKNPKIASSLLPTTRGCFFGSTDYDQWYYADIEKTIYYLEDILRETNFEHEIVMYASSW